MIWVRIRDPLKPRRRRSNANDIKDLVQEARETNMPDKEYFARVNKLCGETGSETHGNKELLKARTEHDFPFRKERGM